MFVSLLVPVTLLEIVLVLVLFSVPDGEEVKLPDTEEESVELREVVVVTVPFSDTVPLVVKLLVSLLVPVTLLENVLMIVSFSVPERERVELEE